MLSVNAFNLFWARLSFSKDFVLLLLAHGGNESYLEDATKLKLPSYPPLQSYGKELILYHTIPYGRSVLKTLWEKETRGP